MPNNFRAAAHHACPEIAVRRKMKSLSEADFLRRMETCGVIVDAAYPKSAILGFRTGAKDTRFWDVPPRPERRPYFMKTMLELMGDWTSCFAWRHMGSWPDQKDIDPLRINDCVEFKILNGIGIPAGTSEVIEYTQDETPSLVTLLFATSIFGWSVGEDLYVIPDHGKFILKADHHSAMQVEFAQQADISKWTQIMADRGFPLPDDLPDETFKRPDWM